jgi:sec-independent protein translocase protein TatB
VFGVSLPEFLVLGTVALLVLGPDKLPGMLRTMGHWIAKLRRLTTEVRHQSGIDDVLRAEGFEGGLNELRGMMRGGAAIAHHPPPVRQPVVETFVADKSREYPVEGPDAYGALPEDLYAPAAPPEALAAPADASPVAAEPVALPAADDPAALPGASATPAPAGQLAPAAGPPAAPAPAVLPPTSPPSTVPGAAAAAPESPAGTPRPEADR